MSEYEDNGTRNDKQSCCVELQTRLDIKGAQLKLLLRQLNTYEQQIAQITSNLLGLTTKVNKINEYDEHQENRITKLENETRLKITELETKVSKQYVDLVNWTVAAGTKQDRIKEDVQSLKGKYLNFCSTLNAQTVSCQQKLESVEAMLGNFQTREDAQEEISKLENKINSNITKLKTNLAEQNVNLVNWTALTVTKQDGLKKNIDVLKEEYLKSMSTLKAKVSTCQQELESVQETLNDFEGRLDVKDEIYHNLSSRLENKFTNINQVIGKLQANISAHKSQKPKPVPGPGLVFNTIACEHSMVVLICLGHGETIKVINANYGRTEPGTHTCPHGNIHTINCHSATSKQIVATRCNGRKTCEVSASNSVFGDPCVGTYKYLKVGYSCVDQF